MFHFAKTSRGSKRVIAHTGRITLLTRQGMSSENQQSIRIERSSESHALRMSNVVQLHGKREEVETGFQTFDVEHHAAGFCACCMRGE
jgi:hypothetical protein